MRSFSHGLFSIMEIGYTQDSINRMVIRVTWRSDTLRILDFGTIPFIFLHKMDIRA